LYISDDHHNHDHDTVADCIADDVADCIADGYAHGRAYFCPHAASMRRRFPRVRQGRRWHLLREWQQLDLRLPDWILGELHVTARVYVVDSLAHSQPHHIADRVADCIAY